MNPYDTIARYYDIEHAELRDDIEMYRQFAARDSGAALVAGVGTGRVALALTSSGREVWGIDNNLEMLTRARESARGASGVTLTQADIRDFDVDRSFSLIVVPLDTFLNLTSVDEQLSCLKALRRHLKTDGILLIDVVNPLTLPAAWEEGLLRQRHRGYIGEETLTIFDSVHIDHAAQEMNMHLTYDISGSTGTLREVADLRVRWVYRFELAHLCALSELSVSQVYGDYDLDPYDSSSPRMIMVAEGVDGKRFTVDGGW